MRDGYRIIDCDRHLVEPPDLWTRYVDRPFRHYIGTLVPTLPNPHGLFAGNNAWRGVYKRFQARGWDNVGYLADMDRERVDTAVLFSTAGLGFCWFEDLDAELCDALCRAYNNWLHDYCSLAPERMIGMAMLPLKEPKLAVRELRRAVEELGFRGIFWRPNPHFGRVISDPAYYPVLEAAQDLGARVGYHEGFHGFATPARGGDEDGTGFRWLGSTRTDTRSMSHACRHPMEQTAAFVSVACDGVLDRFPRLQFAFLESGCGWLPALLERLDLLYDTPLYRASYGGERRPSEYFARGQRFISCEADEEGIAMLGRLVGQDCLMWASDVPHSDSLSYFPNTVAGLLENEAVSAEFKRKILWDTPARFYRLEPAAVGASV